MNVASTLMYQSNILLRTNQTESVKNTSTIHGNDNITSTTPCRISNDPGRQENLSSQLCNITDYRCSDLNGLETIQVLFDYDILHNRYSDIGDILPYLEEFMLDYLASGLGVGDCSTDGPLSRRILKKEGGGSLMQFAGVGLQPKDRLSVARCFGEYNDGNIVCSPVEGGVTVYLASTNIQRLSRVSTLDSRHEQLQETIIDYLKVGMNNDAFVVKNIVDRVVFVGNRTLLAQSLDRAIVVNGVGPPHQAVVPVKPKMPNTYKGLISAGAIVCAIFISLVFFLKKRKDTTIQRLESEDSNDFHVVAIQGYSVREASEGYGLHPKSLAVADSLASQPRQMDTLTVIEPMVSQRSQSTTPYSVRYIDSADSFMQPNLSPSNTMGSAQTSRTWGPDDTSYAYSLEGQRLTTPVQSLRSESDSVMHSDVSKGTSRSANSIRSAGDEDSTDSQESDITDSDDTSEQEV
jgi:hypothetical protein